MNPPKAMVKVGIAGVTGYSGKELFGILLGHPQVRVTYVAANQTQGTIDEIWPEFSGRSALYCEKFDLAKACGQCDIVFLALPHTESMNFAPQILRKGKKVIDLSADYRLKRTRLYEAWYGRPHKDPAHLSKAVYGLPELYREKIKKAALLANPGCYSTAAILGLAPLISAYQKAIASITIDAKSGTSGAGRKAALGLMFCEVNENFKAYKVLTHQHTPEIEQYLSAIGSGAVKVTFVPHLLPINRGILETIYVRLDGSLSLKKIYDLYRRFYKIEPFVRVLEPGRQPEIKNVERTNFCDIGLALSKDKEVLVITSVIDNLTKGAAGQAVQNMNLMCGFAETEGLL